MVNGSPYAPRPSSYAGKALAYLMANGETPSGPLAEAIGCEVPSLHGMIEHAVSNGAIKVEKRDGLRYWSVGDGVKLLKPQDDPEDLKPRAHRRAKAPAVPVTSTEVQTPAPSRKMADAKRAAFRCALWSDGSLVLELDDRPLVLDVHQTRELVRYLDRLAPEVAP